MRCSEVKSDLPLYSDDILTAEERSRLEAHLDTCPLCRQSLSEYQSIKNGLRSLARPALSAELLANLRGTIAMQFRPAYGPTFRLLSEGRKSWFDAWFVPSTVGTFGSLILGMFLLWAILSSARDPGEFVAMNTAPPARNSIMLARDTTDLLEISPSEYASSRLSISGESPSINPQGALVALTKSLVRGEMHDDEVVVVADVFGNGLARIAEVVEPTRDSRAVERLQKALESDPAYAPFVPASFDGRSDKMRVVLKFQNVDVKTSLNAPRRGADRRPL